MFLAGADQRRVGCSVASDYRFALYLHPSVRAQPVLGIFSHTNMDFGGKAVARQQVASGNGLYQAFGTGNIPRGDGYRPGNASGGLRLVPSEQWNLCGNFLRTAEAGNNPTVSQARLTATKALNSSQRSSVLSLKALPRAPIPDLCKGARELPTA
jgi:hypothetical protein